MTLPPTVQEIADIIGRHEALFLIGQQKTIRYGSGAKASERVTFYVPTSPKRGGPIESAIGMERAALLSDAFGGYTLHVANCKPMVRAFYEAEAVRLTDGGMTVQEVADLLDCTARTVRNYLRKSHQ